MQKNKIKKANEIYEDYTKYYSQYTKEKYYYNYDIKKNQVIVVKKQGYDHSKVQQLQNSTYKGKLYIITNKTSGSASEVFIHTAKIMYPNDNQVCVIGQDTRGCLLTSGSSFALYLPNSKISVGIPSSKMQILNYTVKEGKGRDPDYWCTDEDIIDTLFYLTNNDKVKEIKLN